MDDDFDDRPRTKSATESYDHLIDAEREALSAGGREVGKIALIKALRQATGLGLRDAKRAVEGYMARRGGRIPPGPEVDRPPGWIDDLLDAERASATQEERPLTKMLLIKALRNASGLDLRDAKLAVEDYLRRRGGEGLQSGGVGRRVAVAFAIVAAVVLGFLWMG